MKTDFKSYLRKDVIFTLDGKKKHPCLKELIEKAAERIHMEYDALAEAVWKREKQMTTAVGQGLGIPHIRVHGLYDATVLIGVCSKPIKDYKSVDGEPVSLIVFIVGPDDDQENYLKLLGSISKRLKDKKVIDDINENIDKPLNILKILKG